MNCEKCKQPITIKNTERFISLKCSCEITIIYPNKQITTINKKDYNPKHTKEGKKQCQ